MNVIQTTEVFDKWLEKLNDKEAYAAITVRVRRAEFGNFGDCKSVGGGVSEMRINIGAGYRVYFTKIGMEIYVLLAGGSKASQQNDIDTAIDLAKQLKG